MEKSLSERLADVKEYWADIEAKTGVTQQTIRNIVKDPDGNRSRVTVISLEAYLKKMKK